jgi:hypothetical protein
MRERLTANLNPVQRVATVGARANWDGRSFVRGADAATGGGK